MSLAMFVLALFMFGEAARRAWIATDGDLEMLLARAPFDEIVRIQMLIVFGLFFCLVAAAGATRGASPDTWTLA